MKDSVRMLEKIKLGKSSEGQSQRPASSASTSTGYLMHPQEGYHSSTQAKSHSAPRHTNLHYLKKRPLDSADLPQYDGSIKWRDWSDQECQIKSVCA